jgi:hypothetical protein
VICNADNCGVSTSWESMLDQCCGRYLVPLLWLLRGEERGNLQTIFVGSFPLFEVPDALKGGDIVLPLS